MICGALCFISLPAHSKLVLNEQDYAGGLPDERVKFPSEVFEKAKELKSQKRYVEAEEIMLANLDQARRSSRGTPMMGKYLIRLNNILFDLGKTDESISAGEIGARILAKSDSSELITWKVNGESYLGFAYQRKRDFPRAVQKYREALRLAGQAPTGTITPAWMETLKSHKRQAEEQYPY